MAVLTPLSLDDARRVAAPFGLDVTRVKGLLAGSVNSNFELGLADGGRAFLRVYEEQRADAATGEAALLDHLARGGVATPRPLIAAGGGFIAEHAGKPVALFPWIEGEMTCQRAVDPCRAGLVGAALARVHAAGEGYVGAPESRFGLRELSGRLDVVRARPDLPPDVVALLPGLDRRVASLLAKGPAAADGVIHGDLFRDNVLFTPAGEIAALLDFESASRGSFAFDLMVTVLAWCVGDALDPALARAMLRGYAAVREPTAADRAGLFDAAIFAALRFTITRITDFELRPRGSGFYKDYRRFLARLEAVEALGETGLAALFDPASTRSAGGHDAAD